MAEATAFFFDLGNNFDSDINDIIIEITANAMYINLYIFEESNNGNICILCHRSAEPSLLDCMVKYTKGQIIHYDSMVFVQVASQQTHQMVYKAHQMVHISLQIFELQHMSLRCLLQHMDLRCLLQHTKLKMNR